MANAWFGSGVRTELVKFVTEMRALKFRFSKAADGDLTLPANCGRLRYSDRPEVHDFRLNCFMNFAAIRIAPIDMRHLYIGPYDDCHLNR